MYPIISPGLHRNQNNVVHHHHSSMVNSIIDHTGMYSQDEDYWA
jgi:hypothetical protein